MNWFVKVLAGASTAFAVAMTPVTAHFVGNPIDFQQLDYHELQLQYGALASSDAAVFSGAIWSSGMRVLRGLGDSRPGLEEPRAVFDFVFSWLPNRATVYPTEGIYYFTTELDGHPVRGNLRIADAATKGTISFAYFRTDDRVPYILELGADQGLGIETIAEDIVELTWNGRTVRFEIPDIRRQAPNDGLLMADERFIGQILDESGIRLFLLFNERTNAFYMVLNEDCPVLDRLEIYGGNLQVGERTGFVYYADPANGRKLLVGVPLDNVRANDFFDGPADQVPFDAFLLDTLYRAYPQTALGDGIDAYGVFLNRDEWCRLAISPFDRYSDLEELARRIAALEGEADASKRYTDMTREFWNRESWRTWVSERLRDEGKLDEETGGVSRDLIRAAEAQREAHAALRQ